jgi:hypothetical protein
VFNITLQRVLTGGAEQARAGVKHLKPKPPPKKLTKREAAAAAVAATEAAAAAAVAAEAAGPYTGPLVSST